MAFGPNLGANLRSQLFSALVEILELSKMFLTHKELFKWAWVQSLAKLASPVSGNINYFFGIAGDQGPGLTTSKRQALVDYQYNMSYSAKKTS